MKYALLLNDMREPNIENIQIVKLSDARQELVNYYKSLLVEPYTDGQWRKAFKKGSELEWFNPAVTLENDNDYWGGIWQVDDNSQIGQGLYKA